MNGSRDGDRPRALIVEDDPAIAQFVQLGLGYEGYDAVVSATGGDALLAADDRTPHVVILDWMLPDLEGPEVARRLRGRGNPIIVMLTARDAVDDRVAGLDAGADDYLIKPFHFPELMARIRAVERRRTARDGEQLVRGDLVLDPGRHQVRLRGQDVRLTPREFDLLRLLMEHAGSVISKSQIVAGVWGYDFAGEDNIVEVYIGYLRDKLADRPPSLIETVRGVGYVLRAG